MTVSEAMARGMELHRRGELAQAEQVYRQVLAAAPGHGEAMHFLGVIAHQVGRNDVAEGLIRESIERTPNVGSFWNNLGQVLRALGKTGEAVGAYRRAIELSAGDVDARANLAIALREAGRVGESIEAAREAVGLGPGRADCRLQLAASLQAGGDVAGARGAVREALAIDPRSGQAYELLGALQMGAGEVAEAEGSFRRAAELLPVASCFNNLGIALTRQGKTREGAEAFLRAARIDARDADSRLNLGQALVALGEHQGAVEAFSEAVRLRPGAVNGWLGLGSALAGVHRHDEAIGAWRRVLEMEPGNAVAHNNIAAILTTTGAAREAVEHYRKALDAEPGNVQVHSNMLLDLHYEGGGESLLGEHLEFGRRHAKEMGKWGDGEVGSGREVGKRLRVGYFSPDFRAHSVADFMAPVLAGHDRAKVEVVCYANVGRPDVYTERLKGAADRWRDVAGMSDGEVAELIRDDGVDVLVDLAGHTAGGRPLVFARRAAPVQVAWLGYPDTSGLAQMDWRITDAYADPVGMTESHFVERLWRLPRTAWCYGPYSEWPGVNALPAEANGYVTFGSFNNVAKVTGATVRLWAGVLKAVSGSRMVVKAAGLASESARRRVWGLFEANEIERGRVELVGRVEDFVGHLAMYGRIDVGLDTFPYHGTTTTCEALYMGVPVVSLAGRTHVSRVGVSLLNNVGLGELVAEGEGGYVEAARGLAGDWLGLAELRRTLRGRMEGSALMDARGFVGELEGAYGGMWGAWCGGGGSPGKPGAICGG